MSDLENELLGLAEDDPSHRSKKRPSGGTSRPKSQAYEDYEDDNDEEDMDMDMDLESDDDDAGGASGPSRPRPTGNPYPLEGQYVDERDRDYLDSLPEIEREKILASRQEEIQKYKDSAQLDAMYKLAGMDGEDDDDDDGPSRKRRKHTSVTTEASRAMAELKNRRKLKDERVQRRAARRERRARSNSLASHDDASSEEGEISVREPWRAASPPRSGAMRDDRRENREEDLDAVAPNRQELNAARLSRYELVDMMYKDSFDTVIQGAYVRLMAGDTDEDGRPKYRVHRLKGIDKSQAHGRYTIEYQGRQVSDSRALICQYGKAVRLFRMADVSNGDIDESEFSRFCLVSKADGVALPRRSELKQKHEDIAALRDRPMTEDEVNRQIDARKKSTQAQPNRQKIVLDISSLMASKQLALRRNDHEAADMATAQLIKLGADPSTGELVSGESNLSEYDLRIQRINENNRRRTLESMAKAHESSMEKRRREEAIVKEKAAKKLAEASEEKETTVAPPVSGLKKGETPQQYVARTIDLDLGDF